MIVFDFDDTRLATIVDFHSHGASAAEMATGTGSAHIHLVQIDAGGEIGPHVAGFGQLFLALDGRGWVSAGDGKRVSIARGQAAYFARGERHAKGSDDGLRALIIQVSDLHLCEPSPQVSPTPR